jgi:hypothetical protein
MSFAVYYNVGLPKKDGATSSGKRPVYLFSILASMVSNHKLSLRFMTDVSKVLYCGYPHAMTSGAWIGSNNLQGFVGAPIESLCGISITDICFTHEK